MAIEKRSRYEARRLAEFVNRALDPFIAKQGFGETAPEPSVTRTVPSRGISNVLS